MVRTKLCEISKVAAPLEARQIDLKLKSSLAP